MNVRVVLAGMPAAALLCLSIGSALAQEAAPAAEPAKPAPITAVLDAGTRSIRLDPMGARVAVPAGFAISHFNSNPNVFALSGDIGGAYSFGALDVWFYNGGSCAEWAAQPSKTSKLVTPKKGAEFYDSRWHPQYKQSKEWTYMCMDRPGGTISIESPPIKPNQVQPIREFTTSLADVFVPRTQVQLAIEAAAAQAAAPPVPTSSVNVDGVYPTFFTMAGIYCAEGRQIQCEAKDNYFSWHRMCREGNAAMCSMIGRMSANSKEWAVSATFYERACELGDKDACKKGKQSRSKAK